MIALGERSFMPRFLFLLAWIFLADSGSSTDLGLEMDPNG